MPRYRAMLWRCVVLRVTSLKPASPKANEHLGGRTKVQTQSITKTSRNPVRLLFGKNNNQFVNRAREQRDRTKSTVAVIHSAESSRDNASGDELHPLPLTRLWLCMEIERLYMHPHRSEWAFYWVEWRLIPPKQTDRDPSTTTSGLHVTRQPCNRQYANFH